MYYHAWQVGSSQQWYDELDNLAFDHEEEKADPLEDKADPQEDLSDDRIHIDCCVSTSPGASEVNLLYMLFLYLSEPTYENKNNPTLNCAQNVRGVDNML